MKNTPWQQRLDRLGLDQNDLARLLGFSENTASRQLTNPDKMMGYTAQFIRAYEMLSQAARDELWRHAGSIECETAESYRLAASRAVSPEHIRPANIVSDSVTAQSVTVGKSPLEGPFIQAADRLAHVHEIIKEILQVRPGKQRGKVDAAIAEAVQHMHSARLLADALEGRDRDDIVQLFLHVAELADRIPSLRAEAHLQAERLTSKPHRRGRPSGHAVVLQQKHRA